MTMVGKGLKKMIGLLLTGMLIAMLAACGSGSGTGSGPTGQPSPDGGASKEPTPSSDSGQTSDEPVELTFWTLGTNGYEKKAEEYKKIKPNVTVKVQNTADQTDHHNNLLTAFSANKGAPDIFMLEIAFIERFKEAKDMFVNLYDLGANDIKGNYLDWKWAQAETDDGTFLLGLPTDVGPTVTYYRADLLEQAGIPNDPEALYKEIDTWDKFAAVAKSYREKTGKPFVDLRELIFNSIRDQGDQIYYDEDENFIGDTNPQIKKAWDYTVKAIQEDWVGKSTIWTPEWGQETNNGDFAVMLAPAWMSGVIKGNAPDGEGKWMITQMPEGSGNWGGAFLTLPKEGKHQKEAYEFIAWMLGQEQQLESFKTNGLMPSIPAIYDDPAFKDFKDPYYNNQNIAVQFAEATKSVKSIKYGKLHDPTDALFKEGLENIQLLNADPQTEWENAIKKIKELNKRS